MQGRIGGRTSVAIEKGLCVVDPNYSSSMSTSPSPAPSAGAAFCRYIAQHSTDKCEQRIQLTMRTAQRTPSASPAISANWDHTAGRRHRQAHDFHA